MKVALVERRFMPRAVVAYETQQQLEAFKRVVGITKILRTEEAVVVERRNNTSLEPFRQHVRKHNRAVLVL